MAKTLTGVVFIRNGITYDYHICETIDCLVDGCDKVIVLDAGSTDGTLSMIISHIRKTVGDCNLHVKNDDFTWSISENQDNKLTLISMRPMDWAEVHGKEKLAYFQNIALEQVKTDYALLIQADECLHEDSWIWIREAMEHDCLGYHSHRINLWGSVDHMLDVPQERKPCSDIVLRLAKKGCMSYGDGESIEAFPVNQDYWDKIVIFHNGFVRKRAVMVDKIINMQKNVFETTPDSKLDGMQLFDPFAWFSKLDLKPVAITHPKYVSGWILERRKEYKELW